MKLKSKKRQASSDQVFQFKLTLSDSAPKIWRRILVPADYTFFALHCAIQNAMGWTDSHLHAFYLEKHGKAGRISIEFPNPEEDSLYRSETRDERKELIADYFGKIMKQCVYCYDFGDGWNHVILFERNLPYDAQASYPQCIAGENACPPEDCGGMGGYEHLQKIIKNPGHEEHSDMLEWLGIDDPKEFDARQFSPADVEFDDPKKRLSEWDKGFGL